MKPLPTFFKHSFVLTLLSLICIQFNLAAQDPQKPIDSTSLFSKFFGTIKRGTVIKTSNNHFYEINDKIEQKVFLNQSEIKVFKEGKKYKISIAGIERLLYCNKLGDVIESNIAGNFSGWDGNTVFRLMNSQVWQQDGPTGTIFVNLFNPAVLIYSTSEGYKMKIEGVNEEPILVRKK